MSRPTQFQLPARNNMNEKIPALQISPQTGEDNMSDIVADAIEQLHLDNNVAIAFNDLQTFRGDAPSGPPRAPPPSPTDAIFRSSQDHNMEFDLIRDTSFDQEKLNAVNTAAIKALSSDAHYHELHNASRSRHINMKSMSELPRKRRSTVAHDVPMLSEASTCDEKNGRGGLHRAKLCCRRHRSGTRKHTTTSRSEDSRLETSPIEALSSLQRAFPGSLPPPLNLPTAAVPTSWVSSTPMLSDSIHTTDTAPHSSGLQLSAPTAKTSNVDSSKLVLTSLERRRALAARFERRAHRRQKRSDMERLSQQMSNIGMGLD